MIFWPLFCNSIQAISSKGDYPPGTRFRQSTTHLDVFMAMFMVCAIEVVIVKILTFEESRDDRPSSASIWFNRFDPDP